MDQSQKVERLKKIKLFQEFKDDDVRIHNILEKTSTKQFKAGDAIIHEGEIGDTLFIMLSGSVRILKRTMENELYTVVILKEHENVYFGEIALLDQDKRSATVIAETNCELLCLNRTAFLELCASDYEFGYKITMQISKKLTGSLRKMNSDVITLFEALVSEVEGEELSL